MTGDSSKQTVVFHHGALGDSVLIWPFLRGLGGATLIAPRGKARLAERYVPGVVAVDGDAPDWSRLFAPVAEHEIGETQQTILRDADTIISFISTGRDVWAENVWAIAPEARTAFVEARPPEGFALPIGVFLEHQLSEQDVKVEAQMPEPRRNTDGAVVVHPGSGGEQKCWPVDRFEKLIECLMRIGRPVVVVLGEVEQERFAPQRLARWRASFDVREPNTPVELAEILTKAAVFVGNDSGPAHLAAQLGLPTVALFGPTDPRVWAPVGPTSAVLWSGAPTPMDWLEVERVAGAVARW